MGNNGETPMLEHIPLAFEITCLFGEQSMVVVKKSRAKETSICTALVQRALEPYPPRQYNCCMVTEVAITLDTQSRKMICIGVGTVFSISLL